MAKKQVNPTRMELTRLKKKLVTAVRGRANAEEAKPEVLRDFRG